MSNDVEFNGFNYVMEDEEILRGNLGFLTHKEPRHI